MTRYETDFAVPRIPSGWRPSVRHDCRENLQYRDPCPRTGVQCQAADLSCGGHGNTDSAVGADATLATSASMDASKGVEAGIPAAPRR